MGCTSSRIRHAMTRVCVTGLEASVQTGDIILFSSKHAASHVTKCFTASTWDHCGLVVKLSPKHVLILEYAGGVYLYPLFTRLYSYYAIQGREIVIRRLKTNGSRAEMQQQVESFVKSVLGQKPPSIEEMVVAVLKQGPALNAFLSKLRGSKEEVEVEDNLSSLFCSKLIAAVYKHIGLIGADRTAGDFLPKHFSQEYDGYIDLQRGASLSPEIPISFDAVQAEVEEVKMRIAERERIKPEALLALVSSLYLSAREVGKGVADSMTPKRESREELVQKLSSLKQSVNCVERSPKPRRLTDSSAHSDSNAKAAYDSDQDSTCSPTSTNTEANGDGGDGGTPASPSRTGPQGGVELKSGPIVDEVLNTNDGGIYSPTAEILSSKGRNGRGPAEHANGTAAVKLEFAASKVSADSYNTTPWIKRSRIAA